MWITNPDLLSNQKKGTKKIRLVGQSPLEIKLGQNRCVVTKVFYLFTGV